MDTRCRGQAQSNEDKYSYFTLFRRIHFLNLEMNTGIHDSDKGLTTASNLPIRTRILLRRSKALPERENRKYKQLTEGHNEELQIIADREHLEDDIRKFLDDTLGNDGQRKHGKGVVLVLGAFDHGLRRKSACVMGVNGKHDDRAVSKESWKPLLSAMHHYLDNRHPLPPQDELSLSDAVMADVPFDGATSPSPFDAVATKASFAVFPPSLNCLGTLEFSTSAACPDVSPASATPPAIASGDGSFTPGPLTPEVIKAALLAAFPAAVVIEGDELQPVEQNSSYGEGFGAISPTVGGDRVNGVPPSNAVPPAECRGNHDFQESTKGSRFPDPHAASANTTEVRRSSSRFGGNYTHAFISMKRTT
ncbi:hypothetical protein BDN72DRAFT_905276 [Pluteus cervinus]|uniref:Uncharacterized protein n=1 Tax=Pluteus cervinus TaxID=181527 RepID=A0ACD3A362_9AGAR|nr:hypothetical protein BDN72DRAFT_905276 [Pluteus cervinus]